MSTLQQKAKKARRTRKTLFPEYYQLRMTKEHRQMLDALSEQWSTTPAEVLRRLIFERYSELDESGKLRAVVTMEAVDKEGNPVGKKQLVLGLDSEN